MNEPLISRLATLFSRFPRFDDTGRHYRLAWRSHSVLYENMHRFLHRHKNFSEDECARYFLQVLQYTIVPEHPQDLSYAQQHLISYLCTTSYIVAKKLYQTHQNIEFFQHRYDERDYLQIAVQYANDPVKLLGGFDFQRRHKDGKLYFIKTFAKAVLERKIKDELYKYNQESILGKYKDWGILRYDTTFKELKLALQSHIDTEKIEQYLLVWHWFKEICKPCQKRSDRASPPPNPQELKIIISLYKNHYSSYENLEILIQEEQIEKMLKICIEAMQNHRSLKLYYPDSFLSYENDRDRWDEIFINRNDNRESLLLNSLIREEEHHEVADLVRISFESLSSENKTLLILWKGLNLTQNQIGLVVDMPQYTVSRKLKKSRQLMLKKFTQKLQQYFSNCHLDSDTIGYAKEEMEEVLAKQSREFFALLLQPFSHSLSNFCDRNNSILKIRFLQSISQILNVDRNNLNKIIDNIDIFLQENIR